jgi:hypothetical protein
MHQKKKIALEIAAKIASFNWPVLACSLELIYRGYYTAARRYDFYLRVVKTIETLRF